VGQEQAQIQIHVEREEQILRYRRKCIFYRPARRAYVCNMFFLSFCLFSLYFFQLASKSLASFPWTHFHCAATNHKCFVLPATKYLDRFCCQKPFTGGCGAARIWVASAGIFPWRSHYATSSSQLGGVVKVKRLLQLCINVSESDGWYLHAEKHKQTNNCYFEHQSKALAFCLGSLAICSF